MGSYGGILGSSISALTHDLDVVSNNIANMHTSGYKRRLNTFSRIMQQQMQKNDKPYTSGDLKIESSYDFSQGILERTNRSMDLAIIGKGYFVLETPHGLRFTRNGSLRINPVTRQIIDMNNNIMAGQNGPLVVPQGMNEKDVNIARDGNVTAGGQVIGRLRMVDFGQDEARLIPAGNNLLKAPEELSNRIAAQPQAMGTDGYIISGNLERSNVNMTEETVNLITLMRLYEMNINIMKRKRELNGAMLDVAKNA